MQTENLAGTSEQDTAGKTKENEMITIATLLPITTVMTLIMKRAYESLMSK
jgi:hypothetical protein